MNAKLLIREFYLKTYQLFSGSGLYKYKAIRNVNKFFLKTIRQQSVVVNGLTLFLDKKDSLNLSIDRNYEPIETQFLKETIKPGSTVIDIGANIGYYTTLLAKLVGEKGRVYAFEPDAENFALLKKNIEINGFKNVIVENLAISNASGEIKLYYSNDKGDQRIYDSNDGRPSISIKATSVDDYLNSEPSQNIDFIKMDIQGAEGAAILGMTTTIQKNKSILLNIEYWPFGLEKSGFGAHEFLQLLDKLSLSYYDLNLKTNTDMNPHDFEKIYTPTKKNFTNLICSNKV